MRKIFLIASSLLFVTLTNAQVLTYEMVQNSTNPKKDLQKEYMEYTASDGHNYCVGQKITIGTPSSNKTFAYMTSELAIASAFMGGGKVDGIGATYAGSQMKIKSIKVERNKNRGAQVVFRSDLAGLGGVLVQIENSFLQEKL